MSVHIFVEIAKKKKNTSKCVEALVEGEIDDGRRPCLVFLKGIQQFAVLMKFKKKGRTKNCGMVLSLCLHLNYDINKVKCHQTEGLDSNYHFNYMMMEANFAHAYKLTYRKQYAEPYLCVDISLLRISQDVKLMQSRQYLLFCSYKTCAVKYIF